MIPAIAELQKDTPAGCCVFCQEPIQQTRGRKAFRCLGKECQASYHRLYGVFRRDEMRKQGLATNTGKPPKNPNDPRLGTRRG